ncbi:ABC transporter permease [Ancrocorticia populi]|uniref:ABC transporter permease n=1 Tax=Ancrocorticia populi TaxID=2175228 RepID=UPI003F993070
MKKIVRNQLFWAGVVLLVLVVVVVLNNQSATIGYANGRFTGPLVDLLVFVPPILMISLGMTLVIATSGIDLSVGSVMAVAGAVSMQFLVNSSNANSPGAAAGAVALALIVGVACGMFSGFLVSVIQLQPFITTLIMMLAGRGIANMITGGRNAAGNSNAFNWIAQGRVLGLPVGFLIAVIMLVLVWVLVRKTALGMSIEAVGINPKSAEMAGIQTNRILFMVYALSGFFAAVAGILSVAYIGTVEVSSSGTGATMEMDAILAVVIGGTSLAGGKFNLGGTVLGAFIITALSQVVVYLGISAAAVPAFKAVVIIFICMLQADRVHGWFSNMRRKPSNVEKPSDVEKATTEEEMEVASV